MKAYLRVFAVTFACALLTPALSQEPSAEPVDALTGAELLTALRQGGFVLYFRHTATDFGQSDEGMTSYADCAKQRNLTEQGREQAREIGAAIRQLKIPVGKVLSSPYCRTTETATLAFGRAEKSRDLTGGPVSSEPTRYAPLRKQLGTAPKPVTNTMLVGHGNPFRSIAGAPHLSEGEAALIEPLGESAFRIRARIRIEQWEELRALP